MNKILIILLIGATIILGVVIAYRLNIPPAVALVEGAQEKFTELTSGVDTNVLMGVGGTAITTAGPGIAVSQFNQKKAAISSAISSSNLAKDAEAKIKDLTGTLDQTKTEFTTQIDGYKQTTENAIAEAEAAKAQVSSLQTETKNLQSQIDALHQLIPNMKDKDLQTVVQKALRIS